MTDNILCWTTNTVGYESVMHILIKAKIAVDILDQGRLLTVSKPPCLLSLLYLQNGICAAKSQFYMDCFCNMKVLKASLLQLLAKPVFSHHFQAAVNHVHSPKALRYALPRALEELQCFLFLPP